MSDAYTPIKGKCTWWREMPVEDDVYDTHLREYERRVVCSCFVEGLSWTMPRSDVPNDCPENRKCRYYIKHL